MLNLQPTSVMSINQDEYGKGGPGREKGVLVTGDSEAREDAVPSLTHRLVGKQT